MTQSTLGEVFDLSWGVTVALENYSGSLQIGDTLSIGARRWKIAGLPIVKKKQAPVKDAVSVTLADVDVQELRLLIGQPFQIVKGVAV